VKVFAATVTMTFISPSNNVFNISRVECIPVVSYATTVLLWMLMDD